MAKNITKRRVGGNAACAVRRGGLDVSGAAIDCGIDGLEEVVRLPHTDEGLAHLARHLDEHGVGHVVIEATGGLERKAKAMLKARGLRVDVVDPNRVRAYAKAIGQRAKTDRIDARVIAAYAAQIAANDLEKTSDPRLDTLAELVALYQQHTQDAGRWSVRATRVSGAMKAEYERTIAFHKAQAARILAEIVARIESEEDLARRFELVRSVPGVGPSTAATLVATMPELGHASRGEIAALAGLAPYDRSSGGSEGERHIAGGRARPRQALFAAAMIASLRWNPALVQLRHRLKAKADAQGKKRYRSIIVACARKLLVQINAVVARGTPWVPETA